MWILNVSLVTLALTLCPTLVSAVCGVTPPVWRNNNITCPHRAICADVFQNHRNWYNGTTCDELRTLHNCLCDGGVVCPYTNSSHLHFSSARHRQYTCEAKCSMPYCSNIPQRDEVSRSSHITALTAEQNAREFGGRTYYRMDCRCPRHHIPGGGYNRAVAAYSHSYNYRSHRYATLYRCLTRGNEGQMRDPCAQVIQV